MTGILLALFLFAAQPQTLPQENQRQIERLQDRMELFQRQLDRIEHNTEQANESPDSNYLLRIIAGLLGLDKTGYWIARRRNGGNFNARPKK